MYRASKFILGRTRIWCAYTCNAVSYYDAFTHTLCMHADGFILTTRMRARPLSARDAMMHSTTRGSHIIREEMIM